MANVDNSSDELFSNSEHGINLADMLKSIWEEKLLFIKLILVFLFIGLIIIISSKVEYEAYCKLMPEKLEGMQTDLGGLGSLAGLAGINLDMGSEGALTPDLYPQIAQSIPFLLKLWEESIHFEKYDTMTTSYLYFTEIDKPSFLSIIVKFTIGLPFQIKKWMTDSDQNLSNYKNVNKIIRLNREDTKLLEKFKDRINVSVDPQSGILTLQSEMPDALAAAELAQFGIDLLTKFITNYKVSKAKVNLGFVQDRYNEAKSNFESSQEILALFNDRNQNVVTSLAQAESQRLLNEYNLNFEVYKGLASQLEQAKIKVKDETPVFTVLEPVSVPVYKSKPQSFLILFLLSFAGFFTGMIIIFIRKRHSY